MRDEQLEHERRELELALLRLSALEGRVARVEILARDRARLDDAGMSDPTTPAPSLSPVVMPTGWRANRAMASVLSLHTLLLVLCAVFKGMASMPQLSAYAELLNYLALACGGTSVPAMINFKTPAEQAMINHVRNAGMLATTPQPLIAVPGATGASLRALLPLALFASILLAGCVGAKEYFKCLLGQLPQAAQPAIPSAVQALELEDSNAAIAALEQIGFGLLPGQPACIVKAIRAQELANAEKVKGQRSRASINIIKNADAYLAKYPATACAPDDGSGPARASALPAAGDRLAELLAERDARPVDLVEVGKTLTREYGVQAGAFAVVHYWEQVTDGAPLSRVGDVGWLIDQPPRVRDVAWLLAYPAEWIHASRDAK